MNCSFLFFSAPRRQTIPSSKISNLQIDNIEWKKIKVSNIVNCDLDSVCGGAGPRTGGEGWIETEGPGRPLSRPDHHLCP